MLTACSPTVDDGSTTGILSRKHWLRNGLSCGVGFILLPHLLLLFWFGDHPWGAFGFKASFPTVAWEFVAMPVLLLGAWLPWRIWHKKREKTRGFAVVPPSPQSEDS